MAGVYIVLTVGVLVSFAVLGGEIIWHKRRQEQIKWVYCRSWLIGSENDWHADCGIFRAISCIMLWASVNFMERIDYEFVIVVSRNYSISTRAAIHIVFLLHSQRWRSEEIPRFFSSSTQCVYRSHCISPARILPTWYTKYSTKTFRPVRPIKWFPSKRMLILEISPLPPSRHHLRFFVIVVCLIAMQVNHDRTRSRGWHARGCRVETLSRYY